MKKYLPVAILAVGVLVLGGVFLATRGQRGTLEEEENAPEIPVEQRPAVALIPKSDGHYLKLSITGIKVPGAVTLDYELLYKVGDGRTQGVPGTVKLAGSALVERDILLGSESSGKFRYDEGVETGTLTLRFRNDKGKLIGKLSTDFHLQTGVTSLTSVDGSFKYTLASSAKGVYFVTMKPFVKPETSYLVVFSGDHAIFSSDGKPHAGTVE